MLSETEVKTQIVSSLQTLLPQLEIAELRTDHAFRDCTFDFAAMVKIGTVRRTILGEVKSSGQPRLLRQSIAQLKGSGVDDESTYYMVAAPYISPRGMEICRRHKVGCVDLVGNIYLEFDGVYIERIVEEKPPAVERRLRNLFAPVSSRIARAMLEEPHRVWTLTGLAEVTGASLGQVYKVTEKLAAEEFASKDSRKGVALIDPTALLNAWRDQYSISAMNAVYSLHSPEMDPARLMARVQEAARSLGTIYAFTLHAGASLIAPFVRFNDVHFYVGSDPQSWVSQLDLREVEFGGNAHILQPYDEGVFYRVQSPQGMSVVGNIQLYLDLYNYPARGREQAEFLRDKETGF